ncbi:unnamed protein product [Linum tenue]|uniref:WIT1/2 N-terminal helical bundle domain-containing protein n=1 Tax=Linum tenue TaxID=586396 RepID=A0AAV0N7L6_9ROSI|nr:unnamed protein product [Linum tenue]
MAAAYEISAFPDDINNSDTMADSSKTDLYVEISSNGEVVGITPGDILTRVELDLAYASEKSLNLSLFTMQVANREADFEALVSASDVDLFSDTAGKGLEFDLLSGILEFLVSELDQFLGNLQADIDEVSGILYSYKDAGGISFVLEEKLQDCNASLQQLQDQVSDIYAQSSEFRRTLSSVHGEPSGGNGGMYSLENDQPANKNSMIDMKTAEHQRQILKMLEKSLAREMDHEKKLAESTQLEEELRHRLQSAEEDAYFMDEEVIDVWERCFAAENTAEILMGTSKELLGQLQVLQFNLTCTSQREAYLKSRLKESSDQVDAKETALQKFNSSSSKLNDFLLAQTDSLKAKLAEAEDKLVLANSEAFTLSEKVCLLEKQLKESEFQEDHSILDSEITRLVSENEDLKVKLSKAESKAESEERKCQLLTETNMELNEEIEILKLKSEKVGGLEKQLKDYEIRIQHAAVSAEASQEKQTMLYSTIGDMENLIDDLKLKVCKAEGHADSAEDKCIILSESNAELNEELGFLRGRLERLEAYLNRCEETKLVAAKGISFQSKVMTDLVMQLAIERERLRKQLSSLASENKTLLTQQQQTEDEKHLATDKEESDILAGGSKSKVEGSREIMLDGETKAAESELGAVVDVGLSNRKQVLMAMVVVLISATFYLFQPEIHEFFRRY